MLTIQAILRSMFPKYTKESLADLTREMSKYSIDLTFSTVYPNLCLFKYGIEARFNPTSVQGKCQRECRGLILDSENSWNVVCYPYNKFFNAEESNADILDLYTCDLYEKLDGSLVNMWYYGGKWNFSTSGSPDAKGNVGNSDITFAQLIADVWNKNSYFFPDSEESKYFTFMFELCSSNKEQWIVVQHSTDRLVLHGARHNIAFVEFSPESVVELYKLPYEVVKKFSINDEDNPVYKARDMAEEIGGSSFEGFVVVDSSFRRVKIKSSLYVKLHRMKDRVSTKNLLPSVRDNDYEEIIAYFPETKDEIGQIKDDLLFIAEKIDKIYNSILDEIEIMEPLETEKERRKIFALKAMNSPLFFHALMYLYSRNIVDNYPQGCYDGMSYVRSMTDEKLYSFFMEVRVAARV